MWLSENDRRKLVTKVTEHCRTFGGPKKSDWGNPLVDLLKDEPPQFAAGVDVRSVVDLIVDAIITEVR